MYCLEKFINKQGSSKLFYSKLTERALNAKLAANLENLQKKIKELEEENENLIDRVCS